MRDREKEKWTKAVTQRRNERPGEREMDWGGGGGGGAKCIQVCSIDKVTCCVKKGQTQFPNALKCITFSKTILRSASGSKYLFSVFTALLTY